MSPTPDETEYMTFRGLWDDFRLRWTPVQKAAYLSLHRGQCGKTITELAAWLAIPEAEFRRELDGLWGTILWDRSKDDTVPILRD